MANRVGARLSNYSLIRLLGKGGFAEVYLGEHVFLKTHAAMKVLHIRLAKDALEDFLKLVFIHPQSLAHVSNTWQLQGCAC